MWLLTWSSSTFDVLQNPIANKTNECELDINYSLIHVTCIYPLMMETAYFQEVLSFNSGTKCRDDENT